MNNKEQSVRIHSVKYNFIMNIILKISQYIFPLITLPYITRTLGTIGNGKVAFASSVVSYFSMLLNLESLRMAFELVRRVEMIKIN